MRPSCRRAGAHLRASAKRIAVRLVALALFVVALGPLCAREAHAQTSRSVRRTALRLRSGTVLAFPPENRGGKQPVFVYLHGIAGGPGRGCAEFSRSVSPYGWLVCPHGNVREGAVHSWGGSVPEQWAVVQGALASVANEADVDPGAPVVLLGYSQGAYLAEQLLRAFPKKVRAALFVGANVRLSKQTLVTAGVSKVAYAAGQYDGTYAYQQESQKLLEQEGFPVQFRTLGRVGHTYIGETEALNVDALVSWIATD
jgi:predicted esterase